MKGTENFKAIIQAHLNGLAEKDNLFAETLKKPKKNIDDCIKYILNQVQKSGCNGFEDEEIFGMAVHYYDEDDIKIGNQVNASVVVNRSAPATKPKKEKQVEEPKPQKEKVTPAATKSAKKEKEKIQVSSLFD